MQRLNRDALFWHINEGNDRSVVSSLFTSEREHYMRTFIKHIAITIGLCLFFAVSSIFAVAPNTTNYQGRLLDNAGNPVADGGYSMRFVIYDAAVAGAIIWDAGFQNVNTIDGLFSYELGSNVVFPSGLFADTLRWLGITIGGDPELVPRTRFTSRAFAREAVNSDTAGIAASVFDNSITGAKIVDGTIGSADIDATQIQNRVVGVAPSGEAIAEIKQNGSVITVPVGPGSHEHDADYVEISGDVMTGSLGFSNGATPMTYIYQSGTNNSSRAVAAHSPAFPDWGFMYDDLADEFVITGAGDTNFVVKPFGSGTDAVRLGDDAISAPEILDEPGVAHIHGGSGTTPVTSTSYVNVLTRTITCPTAGYVIVTGSGQISCTHVNGTNSLFVIGAGRTSVSLPSGAANLWQVPPGAASGVYVVPFSAHEIYTAVSGANTFYLVARKSAASDPTLNLSKLQLSILFVPTAYGTVD